MPQILRAIPEYLARVAADDLRIDADAIPLSDVQTAWNQPQRGRRIVLVPSL